MKENRLLHVMIIAASILIGAALIAFADLYEYHVYPGPPDRKADIIRINRITGTVQVRGEGASGHWIDR